MESKERSVTINLTKENVPTPNEKKSLQEALDLAMEKTRYLPSLGDNLAVFFKEIKASLNEKHKKTASIQARCIILRDAKSNLFPFSIFADNENDFVSELI